MFKLFRLNIILFFFMVTACRSNSIVNSNVYKEFIAFKYFLDEELKGNVEYITFGNLKHNNNFENIIVLNREEKYSKEFNINDGITINYSRYITENGNYYEKMITRYDRNGNVISREFYENDKLLHIDKVENSYYPDNRIKESKAYNSSGDLTEICNWNYDGNNVIKNCKQLSQKEIQSSYITNENHFNELTEVILEQYDGSGILHEKVKTTYDQNGNILDKLIYTGDKLSSREKYEYDSDSKIVKEIVFDVNANKISKVYLHIYNDNKEFIQTFVSDIMIEETCITTNGSERLSITNDKVNNVIFKTMTIKDHFDNWIMILYNDGYGYYREIKYRM